MSQATVDASSRIAPPAFRGWHRETGGRWPKWELAAFGATEKEVLAKLAKFRDQGDEVQVLPNSEEP